MGLFKRIVQKVEKTVSDAGKSVKSELDKAKDNIVVTTQQIGDSILVTTKDAGGSIKSEFKKAGQNIVSTTKNVAKLVDAGKGVHAVNKVVMLPIRGAFLSVVTLNVVGIASALGIVKDKGGRHWEQILQKWWMMGGEKGEFSKIIDRNKTKKHLFEDLLAKKNGFDGYMNASGPSGSLGDKVGAAAAGLGVIGGVLTANPATAPVGANVLTGAGVLGAFSPILKSFSKENGGDPSLVPTGTDPLAGSDLLNPDGTPIITDTEETILGMPKPLAYTLGGILVIGAAIGIMAAAGVFKKGKK